MSNVVAFPRPKVKAERALTRRQLQALHFIAKYCRVHGEMPSAPELGEALGLKSKIGPGLIADRLLRANAISAPLRPASPASAEVH